MFTRSSSNPKKTNFKFYNYYELLDKKNMTTKKNEQDEITASKKNRPKILHPSLAFLVAGSGKSSVAGRFTEGAGDANRGDRRV